MYPKDRLTPIISLSLCLCLCFSSRLSAQAQQPDVVDAWKQRKITLSLQNKSLAAVAGELADKTGRSILIEGEPERSTLDLSKTDTVESLLNEVADAFDYTWHVSKNGVLLFNKRFRSRTEVPQIVVSELNESVKDILAVLRSLPIGSFDTSNIQDQMVSLARSLTPQELELLKQGSKLRLGTLSDGARTVAEQAIALHMFRDIWRDWKLLDEQFAGLPGALLQNNSSFVTNPTSQKQETYIVSMLQYNAVGNRQAGILRRTITEDALDLASIDKNNAGEEAAVASNPLRGKTTLGQAVHALALATGNPLAVSPSLAGRLLIVQFRKATLSQAMNAFAELEDWAWRVSTSNPPMLTRPRRLSSSNIEEARKAIVAALPADMRRFLTGTPALIENEIIPVGLAAYASHENAMRVRSKLKEQVGKEALKFYLSLHLQPVGQKTLAYSQLTPTQREQLALILTLQACASSAESFTSCFDKPTTYESNPADAYLYLNGIKGSSGPVNILIGGDISATQRGGAFGTSLLLDTLTAPVHKMQKASPMPPQ